MAFRNASYRKSMVNRLQGSSSFTTSTSPKLKPYAPTADHYLPSPSPGGIKSKRFMTFVCITQATERRFRAGVCCGGMIALQVSFGAYTVYHQLRRNPQVHLKKSRRETIPEVVEPEQVAEEAEKYVKQSFFRKVAHIQDYDR
ncbi:hypothetical protein Sango_1699600 [Sesamum angolense]|uniref:Uncharacterized protein n=1 Tax=Sesamum angolense TaxID=2727404 RepID=A0AAE1WKY4_9LAMI|nr:hypothetical protein Sango_1699600 [Sesamum angolense]